MSPARSSDDTAPRVSIILTAFNAERYVAQAIRSVQRQTFDDWELIALDDGSTDGSDGIVMAMAESDHRIRPVSRPHQGRRAALTEAHALARGEYVGWIDADDRLCEPALERTVDHLDCHPNHGMVFTDHVLVDQHGIARQRGSHQRTGALEDELLINFTTFHFRLIRQEAFEAVGGINPRHEIAIDYDLCLRLSEAVRIGHLAEPLYEYRIHPQQMSTTRRPEQIQSSARAIRSALRRRNMDSSHRLLVDEKTGRFQLVRKQPARSKISRGRHLELALKSLSPTAVSRSPAERTSHPDSYGFWPLSSGRVGGPALPDLVQRSIRDEASRHGLATTCLGPTLPTLIRTVWSGRTPAFLHIGNVASLFDGDQAAGRARGWLFQRTLARAQAEGARIVWSPTGLRRRKNRLEARFYRQLAHRCDALIVHSKDARAHLVRYLNVEPDLVHQVTPGGFVDVLHNCSTPHARKCLALSRDKHVVLICGEINQPSTLGCLLDRLEGNEIPSALHVSVVATVRSPDLRARLAELASSGLLSWRPAETLASRELAMHFASADAVVLPPESGMAGANHLVPFSMGRPVFAPKGLENGLEQFSDCGNIAYAFTSGERFADLVVSIGKQREDREDVGRANRTRAHELSWAPTIEALRSICNGA